MVWLQLHEACEAGADVNEKFIEDIDPQHAGMTALALASALNRLDLVKVSHSFYSLAETGFKNMTAKNYEGHPMSPTLL